MAGFGLEFMKSRIFSVVLSFLFFPVVAVCGQQDHVDIDEEIEQELDAIREDLQKRVPPAGMTDAGDPQGKSDIGKPAGKASQGSNAPEAGRAELMELLNEERSKRLVQEKKVSVLLVRVAELEEKLHLALSANRKEKALLLYNLGRLYQVAGEQKKAETAYLKTLELDQDQPLVHYNLGVLYDDNFDEPAKARKHYERFLEISPNDDDAPKVVEWLSSLR